MDTRDDAGFIAFGGGLLLQSVDFFPPIVDDPHRFGQISAANALSDIYAMGGEPLTAMNLVGFPAKLDMGILRDILAGGLSKISESGAQLCGGHSVEDAEPKYGLSVTGFVETDKVVRNEGAKVGDSLVLTKPLGLGILTTAVKRELVSENDIEAAIDAAAALNKSAAEAMRENEVSAATDVTGYSFLGHLAEMLRANDGESDGGAGSTGAVVRLSETPLHERVNQLASDGCYPGGLENNRGYLGGYISVDGPSEEEMLPLFDPQTSGGLLISVPEGSKASLLQALEKRGVSAAVVGEVSEGSGIRVIS